jgi:hypothetical protein
VAQLNTWAADPFWRVVSFSTVVNSSIYIYWMAPYMIPCSLLSNSGEFIYLHVLLPVWTVVDCVEFVGLT